MTSSLPTISVIIPVYNEEIILANCLKSLKVQSQSGVEILVVDDGSTDASIDIARQFSTKILKQSHKGPGNARNLGASKSAGEILVFVDADMTFDKNFLKDLTKPIIEGKTIGTFSKNEMNANKNNVWSRCWNLNRGWPINRLIPTNYPNEAPVYRAILKREFFKVNGFETSGDYTDDWSLSEKLGIKSKLAKGAVYYHSNPASLSEAWHQARWIGKNRFLTNGFTRKIRSLLLYNLITSTFIATYKSFLHRNPHFIVFKLIYDLAVFLSVSKSFFGENKSK